MIEIRSTFLADGSSDRALLPVLAWALRQHCRSQVSEPQWADLSRLPNPPKALAHRMLTSVDLFPCEILFVHRDAERETAQNRYQEIINAAAEAGEALPSVISVVPVRMQEAWLLFDEAAIRKAAENPGGYCPIALPRLRDIESLPDPKQILHELLKEASGLKGRRRKDFSASRAALLVTERIDDFTTLRQLSAFQRLEADIGKLVDERHW